MTMADTNLKSALACSMFERAIRVVEYLEDLQNPYLNTENLGKLKIQLSRLDLHGENEIDFETRFCRPFPTVEFDRLYKSLVDERSHWFERCRSEDFTHIFHQAQSNSTFLRRALTGIERHRDLYEKSNWVRRALYHSYHLLSSKDYNSSAEHEWQMDYIRHALPLPRKPRSHCKRKRSSTQALKSFAGREVADLNRPGPANPHVGCAVVNGWQGDENKLFRTEILAAVSILATHVRYKAMLNYFVHPVFVHSFTGNQARILQVHFDVASDKLFVRVSPFIAIDGNTPEGEWEDKTRWQENEENIKLMLRWMAGVPIGHTSYESLDPGEDEGEHFAEQQQSPSKRPLRVAE